MDVMGIAESASRRPPSASDLHRPLPAQDDAAIPATAGSGLTRAGTGSCTGADNSISLSSTQSNGAEGHQGLAPAHIDAPMSVKGFPGIDLGGGDWHLLFVF